MKFNGGWLLVSLLCFITGHWVFGILFLFHSFEGMEEEESLPPSRTNEPL